MIYQELTVDEFEQNPTRWCWCKIGDSHTFYICRYYPYIGGFTLADGTNINKDYIEKVYPIYKPGE